MKIPQVLISQPNGKITGVNARRLGHLPFMLLPNPPDNKIVVAANQAAAPILMSVSGDGPAQGVALMAVRDRACKISLQVEDGQNTRALMNAPIHLDCIFGTGENLTFKPYRLPEALYLDEGRSIVVFLTNLTAVQANVYLGMQCERMLNPVDPQLSAEEEKRRAAERTYRSLPYFYTVDGGVITLTASATAQKVVTIDQDNHFQLFQLSATSTGTFTIDILDATTGESIITAPQGRHYEIDSRMLFGTNQFPFRFHQPRMFRAGQKLIVNVTDTSVAGNDIYLAMGGRAIARSMGRI